MPDDENGEQTTKARIKTIDNLLPEIERRLGKREGERAEYAQIRLKFVELKKQFAEAEERYIKTRGDLYETSKSTVSLYHKVEPSPLARFGNRLKRIWRLSKTLFFVLCIIVAALMVNLVSFFLRNLNLQTLSLEGGFSLIALVVWIGMPKYRNVSGSFLLATILFLVANYTSDPSTRWTLISLGVAVVALGLALHSFGSGEILEEKVGRLQELERKLDEILKRLPDDDLHTGQGSSPGGTTPT